MQAHKSIATSLMLSTAIALVWTDQTQAAEPAASSASVVEEVVVTGSRIPRINETSPNPVAVISSQEAKFQGATHVEDLLNTLPQVNAGLNGGALGPTGTATVDLRGFGAFRTLVLINGRRLNPGDPINPSADLNSVPAALVKRVEVLTGGASSIYGSDAIAGVVNFVMDQDFTGLKFDAQTSTYQYTNGDTGLRALAQGAGANPPRGNRFDGATLDLSGVFGAAVHGGDGHITAYVGHRNTRPVRASNHDYSACNLTEAGAYFRCIRDDNTSPAQFQLSDGSAVTLDQATGNSFRPYVGSQDGFNTAPFQLLQRPDTRFDAGLFGQYTLNKAVNSYLELQYSDDRTTAQYEPAGTALNSFGVNCDNPLLSASEVSTLCTQFRLGPADSAQVILGRRNVEGRPRLDRFRHESYRAVLGFKGAIDQVWSYDAYAQYGITKSFERISNDLSLTKLGRALDVVSVAGAPTCASVVDGSDPACVPYDIFHIGGVSPAAVHYVSQDATQHGYAKRTVLSGVLIGQLGEYGLQSPFSKEGIGVVGGVEYREESLRNSSDLAYVRGDLANTGQQLAFGGTYDVSEVFGEAHIPLAEDRPFVRKLALDLSDRYAKYSLQGSVNAYKVGLEWSPSEDLRFRTSLSQAIRAPNGHELFTTNTISKIQAADPCAGATPVDTLAQCQNTGVTAAQYGAIPDTGNFNVLTGGNTHLIPETANTFTIGAVITPEIASGFALSIDYWRIEVSDYVGQYAPNGTLNNCLNTGSPIFCALVQRDGAGSLSLGSGLGSGRVIATNLNTGRIELSGIDIDGGYGFDLETLHLKDAGRVALHFTGSLALDNKIQPIPGEVFDCTGLFGPTCTGEGPTSPIPKWRHQLRATWSPRGAYQLSVNWRHIGRLDSELGSKYPHLASSVFPVDARIKPYDYIDLAANIDIDRHYNLRAGVDNVFGQKPPVIGSNANPLVLGGNMAASMYDTLGRYMYVGITAKF